MRAGDGASLCGDRAEGENEMSKEPGEFERRKLPSKEEKQARKELRAADARVAMAEHESAAEAFARNRERLRAERLVRLESGIRRSGTQRKAR